VKRWGMGRKIPAQQGYAQDTGSSSATPTPTASESPTATPVDKIHTIVLPVNGSKSIDLGVVYSGFNINFDIKYNNPISGPNVAKFSDNLISHGLLKIDAVSTGKATFTVTTIDNDVPVEDTIDIIVVSTEGYSGLDIKKSVEAILSFPNEYQTKDSVKNLISLISPAVVPLVDPYNSVANHPPIRSSNNTPLEASVGQYIETYELFKLNYFNDSDPDQYLYCLFPDYNNEFIEVHASEGIYLLPKKAGTINFPVIVMDGHGGIIESTIPITIQDPEFINLDYGTVTLDLQSYFPGLNATSFYYENTNEEYQAEISGSNITFNSEHTGDFKIIAQRDGHQVGYKYFNVSNDDYLIDRNLLEGTRLEMDLSRFFSTGTSVSSSVYYSFIPDNTSTVSNITYGIQGQHTLYFDAQASDDDYGTISGTVIANDSSSHLTFRDKITVNLGYQYAYSSNGKNVLDVNNLFDEEYEWGNVTVGDSESSTNFTKHDYGCGMIIETEFTKPTTVTLNYEQNKILYKIPYPFRYSY
jgi:hypothetical protein